MKRNTHGFTLIELTTAILILSVISVLGGMGLVQIAKGYLLTQKSTVASEQAQIALARITKELTGIEAITVATATAITYKRAGSDHTLAWTSAGQPLRLDGDILIDDVQTFSLTYHNSYDASASSYSTLTSVIELTFELKGYDNTSLAFVQRFAV